MFKDWRNADLTFRSFSNFSTLVVEILSDSLNLPANAYEVLPYFIIRHEYFPDGLAAAFGGDPAFTISEQYLRLPSDIVADTLTID